MTTVSLRHHLDALDACYTSVLAGTADFAALVGDRAALERAAALYREDGFVQLPRVVDGAALDRLARELWTILDRLAFDVCVPHKRRGADLSAGGRLRRVDSASLDASTQGSALAEVLSSIGVVELGRLLAERIRPILRHVVPGVGYERVFFNLYKEGDYLTAHDDAHMNERVDVSFPVTMDGVCGLRVLRGELFETYYDEGGAMSILGPRVWHEVPVLLRASGRPPPRRLTMTMRYA